MENKIPNKYKFIISGGGTGGHIFPAIAIANAIKSHFENAEILFVGANGRMEMERVPQAGFKIIGLDIAGFIRGNFLKNIGLPFKIMSSLWHAKKIIQDFKPDMAIGVGGYASGPVLFAAGFSGVPTLIQEQNSFAGITNKLLAKRATKICVAYPNMENVFPASKIVMTGNPVRAEILNKQIDKEAAYRFMGLNPAKKTLLIVGGSLGARTLNEAVFLNKEILAKQDFQILWQTGKNWSETIENTENIKQVQFINRMDLAYSVADVIVSRAGALSISELQNIGKPVILVPSPNVTEDHQTHNALALVNKQAAILVKDSEAKARLISTAIDLMNNENLKATLSENISKMAIANSAERVVQEIEKIVKNNFK